MWSDDDVARLKLLAKTLTVNKIAVEMGRTYNEVRHKIRQIGLTTTVPWQRADKDVREIKVYSDEHGCKKTAEHFGLTVDVVKNIRIRYKRMLKSFVDTATPEGIEKIRKRAINHARNKNYREQAEDFASHVVIYHLEHGKSNLDWLLVDFLRETNGNMRSKKGTAQVSGVLNPIQIMEEFDEDEQGVMLSAPDGKSYPALRIVDQFKLEGEHRAIFVMRFHFLLSLEEMALIYGFSGARMSQKLTELMEHLKEMGIRREDIV